MNFKGRAKRLDDIDLPRIGKLIGVGEDEIHAVIEVETAGGGFDSQGRPRILFEPHHFYKLVAPAKRNLAVKAGLAYPKWGTRPYPKDSYPSLLAAMEIDEEAALKSCSWGLGQIMGWNHQLSGYDSVYAMVEAFIDDEENHLEAMIRFIKNSGLDDELRAHNWAGFARGYNGAGYAKNDYHNKLARAYAKWAKIPDTPFPEGKGSEPAQEAPQAKPVLRMGAQNIHVLELQAQLLHLGFGLVVDGDFGPATRDAVKAFQRKSGLVADGIVGPATRQAIALALPSKK